MEGRASGLPGILTSVSNHLSLLSQTVARLAEQHDQEVVRLTRDLNKKNQDLESQLTRLGVSPQRENSHTSKGSGREPWQLPVQAAVSSRTRPTNDTSMVPEYSDELSEGIPSNSSGLQSRTGSRRQENKPLAQYPGNSLAQARRGPRTGGAPPMIRGDLSDLTPSGPEGTRNGSAQDGPSSGGGDTGLEAEKSLTLNFSTDASGQGEGSGSESVWAEINSASMSGQPTPPRLDRATTTSLGSRFRLAQVWKEGAMSAPAPERSSMSPHRATKGLQRGNVKLKLARSRSHFEIGDGTGSKTLRTVSRKFGSVVSLGSQNAGERHPDTVSNLCQVLAYRMIARPSSLRRLAWEVTGMILIFYDLIVIPLQTFDLESNPFLTLMTYFTAVFWTLDIPSSFLVGFNRAGIIEMRLKPIAYHYVSSWFLLDTLVVGVDWTILIAEATSTKKSRGRATEYLGFGKALRILRLLRLLRLFKVHGMLVDITERVQSEFIRIMLGLVKLLIFIVSMNHVIACGFYGVGVIWEEERVDTWVVENKLHNKSLDYRYTTALHWSLTQFTPASMEVTPMNSLERFYTVCTIIIAMMTFSSLVSSITNAMTQLRNLNSDKLEKEKILRRYLRENNVSVSLMSRIWGWLAHATDQKLNRTHEQDVFILSLLPRSLRTELQDQVFLPFLQPHPWFYQFSQAYPLGMRKIYECIREVSTSIGQEVFSIGEVAHDMFFICVGNLLYEMVPDDNLAVTSTKTGKEVSGGWICEQALWLDWKHRGHLVAKVHSELFGLQTGKFHALFSRELHEVWQAGKYARLFCKHLESKDYFSDISTDFDLLQDLAHAAFSEDPEDDFTERNASQMSPGRGRRSIHETFMSNVFKKRPSGRDAEDEDDEEPSYVQKVASVTGFFGRARRNSKSGKSGEDP